MGWKNEKQRHSMARKGVKTKILFDSEKEYPLTQYKFPFGKSYLTRLPRSIYFE